MIVNQFFSVRVTGDGIGSAAAPAFGGDFREKHISDYNITKQFLQATENGDTDPTPVVVNGTITLAPDATHRITSTGEAAPSTTCTYSLAQDGNNYVVTITAITGTTTLTLDQLHLVIEAIEQGGGGENVVVRVDPSVQISGNEPADNCTDAENAPAYGNGNSGQTESAPAAGNVITAAQISAMIESALAANPTETVLDADLGNDPSLTVDSLIALCEKNNVAKRCHFTHNGMKFVLFVPVVDPTSASYQQCKALLDAEPGKQAGPIRLSLLFAPVGFSLSGE